MSIIDITSNEIIEYIIPNYKKLIILYHLYIILY